MYVKYKKQITIGVILLAIVLVIFALVNSTYALFSVDAYGSNTNAYTTGMLSIEASSKSDNISLTNALPMTDEEGVLTNPYVFTIKNVGNLDYLFDVKLLSTGTSDTTFSSEYIKLQIDDGTVTTLSGLTNGEIKSDVTLLAGESIDISVRIWLSIETPNTQIGKSFNSKIVTDGQAVYTSSNNEYVDITPLSDFVYALGNETPVVNTLTLDGVDVAFPSIELDSNEVLLVDYVGTSVDVNIPDTYSVNGTTYNVIVLSCNSYTAYCSTSSCYDGYNYGVFYGNDYIESVLFGYNVKFLYSSYDEEAINFGYEPSYIAENSARELFYNCTNLNSVNIIPSSVTDLLYTFYGCTNLTGIVRINSSNVSSVTNIFGNTSKDITVEVPAGSTTYTKISALTTSNGMPGNVTLVTY